ncbi:MAG: thioredoxin family protein [Phycisphaerae bacterium]|nr:thioredoxin family protein [Phycisphaerae bacterium]
MKKRLAALAALLILPQGLLGQEAYPFGPFAGPASVSPRTGYVTAGATPSHRQVAPGQTFHVALDMRIKEKWAYYSPDPGGQVIPASMSVDAGGLTAGEVLWPPDEPHEYDLAGKRYVNNAYEGRAIAYVPITVPDGAAHGRYTITLQAQGQVCGEGQCVSLEGPNAVVATARVRVGAAPLANPAWDTDAEISTGLANARPAVAAYAPADGKELAVWAWLSLALLAGLILNITPCVLPVIPLRILSIVEMSRQSRRRFVTLGLSFAAGIMLFFAAIAAVNIMLKLATGSAFNWGDHFQIRAVRVGLALVVVALAANLFGLFNVVVPRRIAGLETGGGGQRQGGHATSLGMGVMTAILATPCSFAYLFAVLMWAQGQVLWLGTLALILVGVGMTAPHVLLAAFPKLLSRLPRPGRWMEIFKQSTGFVLLLVAVWLFSTLTEGGKTYPFWVAGFAVVLAFALWMWGGWVRYDAPLRRKFLVRFIAAGLAIAAGFWMLSPPRPLAVEFEPFDEGQIGAARRAGRVVLVDFTAAWCLSCKEIDALIYDGEEVARELKARDVLAMKGDVTNRHSPADRLREKLRENVPVTVVFPPGSRPPIRLRGAFSKENLFDALDAAAGSD